MTVQNTGGTENQDVNDVNDSNSVDNEQSQAPNLGAIRKAGQREVLSALSKETGQSFNNINDVAAYFKSLSANVGNDNQTTTTKKDTSVKSNSEMAELRHMIESLNSKLVEKDQVVRKTSLQSQIKDVAVKTGFDPSMLDISTNLFEQQIAFDDSGEFYVKGKDGNVRLDAQGNPMSLDQLAAEILKSRPKLAIDDTRTGTGTKFGFNGTRNNGEIPDAATDPAGWKAWKQANGIGGKSAMVGVTVNKGIV